MNPLSLFKTVAEVSVSIGAGAVIGNLIKVSTPEGLKWFQKASIGIGGYAISHMIGEMVAKRTVDQIDAGVEEFKKVKAAITGTPTEKDTETKNETDDETKPENDES